jgi:hypothetical protein
VEYVERQFFGGFPVTDEWYDPREHDGVHSYIEPMERELIAPRNRLEEAHPSRFGYKYLSVVAVKHIAEARTAGIA